MKCLQFKGRELSSEIVNVTVIIIANFQNTEKKNLT